MAGETLTDPADLVQEACELLAGLMPRLARETAEPSPEGLAACTIGRHTVAPVPGNPPAFYARTGIDATARQLEGILLYAAGRRRPGPLSARGGSGANTLEALKAITRLIAKADDDLYRMVVAELEQRLGEAQQVRAIDEAERWRPVPSRPCPRCRCYFLKVKEDARGQPAGQVGCFGHLESGEPCRAAWASLAEIAQDLERAATVPNLDG
jgi:hypothetical protein